MIEEIKREVSVSSTVGVKISVDSLLRLCDSVDLTVDLSDESEFVFDTSEQTCTAWYKGTEIPIKDLELHIEGNV